MVNQLRANRLFYLLFMAFFVLFLNLIRMQIICQHTYRSLSEKNRIRIMYLEAPRGKILDRNGEALATSRLSFNCSAISREAKKNIHKSCQILSSILGRDAGELEARFKKKKPGWFHTVLMAEDIPMSWAMAIEERMDELPGFMIETRPQRIYPPRESVAHIVGYLGPLTQEEEETLEPYGYRSVDWIGQQGLEKFYESYLRGRPGGLQTEVDSRGRFIRVLGMKEPGEGRDLQLTVDGRLQNVVQGLLSSQKGAVIVMELKEGGILSMNSSPSFDPNLFSSVAGRKEVGAYLSHRQSPMVNRSIRGRYPPGSTFKIITALAGLERRKISAKTSFNCPGFLVVGGNRFNCWHESGHGLQTLPKAFQNSCNVFFYNVGLLAGVDAIAGKSLEFGFSTLTGIDLPGEKPGLVPSKEWKRNTLHEPWYEGETANFAIGQGVLQVTPIQLLVMIAAIATDGEILKPHLAHKIGGVKVSEKHARRIALAASDLRIVKEGLDLVINSDTGTGRLARVPGLRVAGKTGTAQSGQDQTHAWFVGYAPFDNPQVAMVVFVENGGKGGVVAAKMAGLIFKWMKEQNYFG